MSNCHMCLKVTLLCRCGLRAVFLPSLGKRPFFVLCELTVRMHVYGCSTWHFAFLSGLVVFRLECVSGSPRGLAKSHIAGSQSPVSPGWDLKTATSAGLWATLRTTLQTMASLTKTWLPSDCCALDLRGQWSGVAARALNCSLKTRVLHCTHPLASCVTLGKPQHLSVPVAASQAQGRDEVGDCYSGCFCNSELVCHSCPEPSLPNWEARYSHSTPPPSIQVPTSVHNHSQLEWSTCLGVSSYSQPCMEPKG